MQRRLMHCGDQKLVVRAEHDAEMRPGPLQKFRLRRHVGKPQGHAVIMRDREPQAFWRKRQPADRRGHVEGFLLTFAAADKGGPAGRPCHRAIGMKRCIVDPAPFWVGREQCHLAFCAEPNQLAVIATHDDTGPVGCRAQDAASMDGDWRDLALPAYQENAFLGADENRGFAEKMHRRDRYADRDRAHPVGDRNDGG